MVHRNAHALDNYDVEISNPAKVARQRLVENLMNRHDLDEDEARQRANTVSTTRLACIGEALQEDRVGNFWDGVPQDTVARFEVNAEVVAIDDLIALTDELATR